MSAPVLRWLNDELKLRRRVVSIERDLSNGYLFAEILSQKGLEQSLDEYRDAPTIEAKVHNMELLGATLESLGLPFPIKTRRAIMMEDRSAVLQFALLLKDFVEGGTSRTKPALRDASAISTPTPKAAMMNAPTASELPPRDVEERFVKTTAQRLQPTEVVFRKDVNMAVHLRKFEQAQWETENELQDLRDRSKAEKADLEAAGIASVRRHLQDKRKFMKEWDREHMLKWKDTQRRDLQLERDDLRLELTLEKRKELFRERALVASCHDAVRGVVEFERNMTRLGLGLGGADQAELQAIPVDDEGAVAHFYSLERRIEELDFRPSSNIKMMKEIKRRRKAQLAAEKDRRVRKQRAAAELKESESGHFGPPDDQDISVAESQVKGESELAPKLQKDICPEYLTETYLQGKLEELELNYAQLRESGQQRRDADEKILQRVRSNYATKNAQISLRICEDVTSRLISLAYSVASTSCTGDADRMRELKHSLFLHKEDEPSTTAQSDTIELQTELATMVSNFLNVAGSWSRVPQESSVKTSDVSAELQRLVYEFDHTTLSTSWESNPQQPLIAMYTEDENGIEIARRVADEHGLRLIEVEQIIEECVKFAYDPQKQADAAALMPERERIFGALGYKLAPLRQKGSPLPDALVVDSVAAAIGVEVTSLGTENLTKPKGCALLNFPRSVDEAKLLETVLAGKIDDQNVRETRLLEIETAFSPDGGPDCERGEMCSSSFDCVVAILSLPVVVQPAQGNSEEGVVEGKRPSTANRPPTGKGRMAVPNQDSQEQLLAQAAEQRAHLARVWMKLTHYLKIDPGKMHVDMVVESIHLSIDIFADVSFKVARCTWELGEDTYPKELQVARTARRDAMRLTDRLKWAKVSNEIAIDSIQLAQLVDKAALIDSQTTFELQRAFKTFVEILRETTTRCSRRDEKLQELLNNEDEHFQTAVNRVVEGLASLKSAKDHEKLVTILEVTLGDLVDTGRHHANQFVESIATDPVLDILRGSDELLQLLPAIFLYIQSNAVDKLNLLRHSLFEPISFLSDQDGAAIGSEQTVSLSKGTTSRAMDAVMALGSRAKQSNVGHVVCEEMLRQLSQIAAKYAFHIGESKIHSVYSLHEANVKSAEITRALEFCALLCNFGDKFTQILSRLNARSIAKLRKAIQDDIHVKHSLIADVIRQIRATQISSWPLSIARKHTSDGIGWRLAFIQREHILSPQHLLELTMAISLQTNGSTTILTQDFVKTVLVVAKEHEFPPRWQDSVAIARVALQQEYCSVSHGAIHWRQWILSLMALSYVGLPSVEQMRLYIMSVCGAIAGRGGDDTQADNLVLTSDEFWQVPLWFEDSLRFELTKANGSQAKTMVRELKRVVHALFSADSGNNVRESSIELLPMLLGWCIHPVCDLGVHPKLAAEFLPGYSRGLLRAFHVLLALGNSSPSKSTVVDANLVIKLFAAAGILIDESKLETVGSWGPSDSSTFLSFCRAYDRNLERFVLLRNSFEALTEQSAASP